MNFGIYPSILEFAAMANLLLKALMFMGAFIAGYICGGICQR